MARVRLGGHCRRKGGGEKNHQVVCKQITLILNWKYCDITVSWALCQSQRVFWHCRNSEHLVAKTLLTGRKSNKYLLQIFTTSPSEASINNCSGRNLDVMFFQIEVPSNKTIPDHSKLSWGVSTLYLIYVNLLPTDVRIIYSITCLHQFILLVKKSVSIMYKR